MKALTVGIFVLSVKASAMDCSVAAGGLDGIGLSADPTKSASICYEYTVCTGEGKERTCTTHKVCVSNMPSDSLSKAGCKHKDWSNVPNKKDTLIQPKPEIYGDYAL